MVMHKRNNGKLKGSKFIYKLITKLFNDVLYINQ